jgi:hypothetical protein
MRRYKTANPAAQTNRCWLAGSDATGGSTFMKRLLLISLCGWLAVGTWAATKPVPLTANQVLDEFARTQDRLLSMVYTVTTTEEVKKGSRFYAAEVRTDANRAVSRDSEWGPGTSTPTSQADPYSWITVSDGKAICRYSARGKRPGTLSIYPAKISLGSPDSARRAVLNYNNAGYLFGHFGGVEDRCDIVLRNASELRVRSQPEPVNGVPCLVVGARRTHGNTDEQFTLWFDPAHGYNIARADIRLGPKGESPAAVFRVNQVTFRQVDSVWVPASAEVNSWQRNTNDGSTSSSKIHVRFTAIGVNPKDEPANAFRLDDVRDGSRVYLVGDGFIKGTWQKGRAVDAKGNVLWTPESLAGMETNKRPQTGHSGGADKPTSAGKK